MMKGVQVVGAASANTMRAYCSHWVCQVSFEEPIVMASVSPKHDTYPLLAERGEFSVSILAADQIAEGQYFSYPGRKFRYLATELLEQPPEWEGLPIVPNSIAYLRCQTFHRLPMFDHELFFARVIDVKEGRLKEPPLLYSSRLGWRATGSSAREPGVSIRDQLLERLAAMGIEASADEEPEE